MNIQDGIGKGVYENRTEETHKAGQTNQLNAARFQLTRKLFVVSLTRLVSMIDDKGLNLCLLCPLEPIRVGVV